MAVFYNEGETKNRPGVYQRHTNTGFKAPTGARDGICAIPVRSNWGPVGVVVKNTLASDLAKNYGTGTYGTGYTVPAAAAMFDGGASVVYTYRMGGASNKDGEAGKKAEKTLGDGLKVTAKYVGTMPISVAVQEKLSDDTVKQLLVYTGTTLVETWDFDADKANEGANLTAAASKSNYIEITGTAATVTPVTVADGALSGGADPVVTNDDYSKAFAALESYYYNTIALDVEDDASMTLSLLLQTWLNRANKLGKVCFAVVGENTDVDFDTRCAHAKAFNDAKVVYLGGGYVAGADKKDGVMAICYTAGIIASTPANQGITHAVISGATGLCESLTFAQYDQAIESGMLLLSVSPDGSIWYDSGINTLVTPDESTQDDGWKKIRRAKVRFEAIDRLDRALAPKVGRVSADSDGIADIVQTGQRVLDAMVNEGKLVSGASFTEDPANPYSGDSGWFIIQFNDIDSLEKIYLQYQFRYSQNT